MQTTIMRFIWAHSKSQQLLVLALTVVSFPILYLSLEIPKHIINDAISDARPIRQLLWFEMGATGYLLALSFALLALVIFNGLFKMRINTSKGVIGERLVRRLRYLLVDRTLRFPLSRFQRVSQGEIIATVIPETEPLADFCGESIALPVFQGGTLLTILLFMFVQNPFLGLASVALIPLQIYIIPKLQKRVNTLKKERVKRVRVLSQRLGESVTGIQEIRAQGTRRYTLAEFSFRFGELFRIRLEIFRVKFLMKFLNNTIGQLTPFLFYSIGGYLVIRGDLTIGALVAALGAYKDILGPWKELLNHYQRYQDSAVKYEQIIEQFQPPDLTPDRGVEQKLSDETPDLKLSLQRISCENSQGERLFGGLTLQIQPGTFSEIICPNSIQRNALAQAIAGLAPVSGGRVMLGEHSLDELSDRDVHSRIGYLGDNPFLFNRAISFNMGYGLNHAPPNLAERSEEEKAQLAEAVAAGNSADWYDESFQTIWTDFSLLGEPTWQEAMPRLMAIMQVTGAAGPVSDRSLFEKLNPQEWNERFEREDFEDDLLRCRRETRKRIHSAGLAHLVSGFELQRINPWSTYAENIVFGVFTEASFDVDGVAAAEAFRDGAKSTGLYAPAIAVGTKVVEALLSLHQHLPLDHELVLRFRLDDPARIEQMGQALDWLTSDDAALREAAEITMMAAFLNIVPGSFNLVNVPPDINDLVLKTRELAMEYAGLENFSLFDVEKYNPGLSVFDNLIFGRINYREEGAEEQLQDIVKAVIDEQEMHELLIIVFLINSQSGIGGSRIPEFARQRIALGRALFKRPLFLVLHDALSSQSNVEKLQTLARVREFFPNIAVVNLVDEGYADDSFDSVYALGDRGLTTLRSTADTLPASRSGPALSDDVHSIVESVPEFGGLTESQMKLLIVDGTVTVASAGTTVFNYDEQSSHVYVLLSGDASVYRRQDGTEAVILKFDKPGLIGEVELLASQPRRSRLTADTECRFLKLEGSAIAALLNQSTDLSRAMLGSMARKVTLAL